jgi:hypothetical protein
MASLYEVLDNAHDGEGMATLGREFGLTPTQAQAAVTALLPAISTGLKRRPRHRMASVTCSA